MARGKSTYIYSLVFVMLKVLVDYVFRIEIFLSWLTHCFINVLLTSSTKSYFMNFRINRTIQRISESIRWSIDTEFIGQNIILNYATMYFIWNSVLLTSYIIHQTSNYQTSNHQTSIHWYNYPPGQLSNAGIYQLPMDNCFNG